MKNKTITPEVFESTYALLVRSEEKERGLLEAVVYLLFIVSAVFSILQFAQQPVTLPTRIMNSAAVMQCANTQPQGV